MGTNKMRFDHFLITRFNLKKKDWLEDKNRQNVLDEDWLNHRIDLFSSYCLPSVLGQKEKEFKWLIFFERDSPTPVNNLIKKLNSYPFIEPIFLSGYEEFQSDLPSIVQSRLNCDSEYVVTTRLDNDDALHKDFIKYLHDSFELKNNFLIDFPSGLFLELEGMIKLGHTFSPYNQFISLVESLEDHEIITVFGKEHDKWGEDYEIKSVKLNYAWLQITHSRNKINFFKGRMVPSTKLNGFNLKNKPVGVKHDVILLVKRIGQLVKKLKTINKNIS
ncbi:MAG: glycosyltransferase [Christiangramia sp.]|uniref:glycosyltransferase n=1 Tax=Christiangramia sp. TaxID=1931228 RepID=UPI0032425294